MFLSADHEEARQQHPVGSPNPGSASGKSDKCFQLKPDVEAGNDNCCDFPDPIGDTSYRLDRCPVLESSNSRDSDALTCSGSLS